MKIWLVIWAVLSIVGLVYWIAAARAGQVDRDNVIGFMVVPGASLLTALVLAPVSMLLAYPVAWIIDIGAPALITRLGDALTAAASLFANPP